MSQFKTALTAEQQIELAEKNLLAQYDALEDFFMHWQNSNKPLFYLSEDINDIFAHAERIKAVIVEYEDQ